MALLALLVAPRAAKADPPSLGHWRLVDDYAIDTPQALGMGPEGVWSFGDDVAQVDNLSGFAAFNLYSGGLWSFHGDAFPPGAQIDAGWSGDPLNFYSHEADHVTRASVAVWTAPRDMSISFRVSAWTPSDGIQNTRSHDVSWRWYDTDGTTLLRRQDVVIGPHAFGANYANRWTGTYSMSMKAGQTISAWHSRRDVEGFVGVDFEVAEIEDLRAHWNDLGTLGGADSVARAINASGQIVGAAQTSDSFALHAFQHHAGTMSYLGSLGGGYSDATAVNEHGDVVGSSLTASGEQHAFRYSNGVMEDLGTLGGNLSQPTAIGPNGDVVGYSYTAGGPGDVHAFLYAGGTMSDLGTLGGSWSEAWAIDPSGRVVGVAQTAAGAPHAFVFSDGVMFDLGTLGGAYSEALAIGEDGLVVGEAETAGGEMHAFLYADGAMSDLGTLGGPWSYATAVNARGQIVGAAGTADGYGHAFLYEDGVMTDLGTLGGPWSYAKAINSDGQVVGDSSLPFGARHGFAFSDGQLTDLGTLGGSDSEATGINDRGEVVGIATLEFDSSHHAVVATLPDIGAPVLEGFPTSPLVAEATGAGGATVTFSAPTATDNRDGSVAVSCDPASGSTFPLGTTTVTCTATDAAGNVGSCTFAVTVVDTTAPSVACPSDVTIPATSSAGATVTFSATASDLVDPAPTVSFAPDSATTFAIGTTTVTCTATDAAGNSSECTFHVTVEGGAAESASLADALSALLPSGSATSDAAISSAIASLDASADPSLWIDGTHVTTDGGKTVFTSHQSAIKTLSKIASPDPVVTQVILATVALDQLVARTAISDATARSGDPKDIAKAQNSLDAGRAADAAGDYAKAANDYEAAWKAAVGA